METEIIEVSVAPGPLGILLNGDDDAHPSLLDGFAPISTEGDIGDVERDGRVTKGSELIGVNEYDFEEWNLTFAEIGQVLRETSHLQRVLRFRVTRPVVSTFHDDGFHEIDESEVEDALGVRSLSPPSSTGTKSWSVKDLRSPRSIADPSLSGSSSPIKFDHANNQESTVRTEDGGDALRRVQVDVPAGPLGLNLDGSNAAMALVLGFVPLPDGSKGPVEASGRVLPGSVLVEVNGEDVSKLPLSEIAALLGALSSEPKQLIFQLPDPSAVATQTKVKTGSTRTVPRFVQDMDKRRKLELALVLKFDSSKLARRECWFMVDANWMSLWVDFAARGGPLPGPITNETLLQEDWEAKVSDDSLGRPDEPREGLQITKDYRAVTPMVWCIFCELHGVTPRVPVLARYVLDINTERIRNSDLKPLLTECRLKAASLVSDLRDQCEVQIDG